MRPTIPVQRLAKATLGCLLCAVLSAATAAAGERYFVDFRARSSAFLGHTYIAYGRVDERGRLIEKHRAGLFPAGGAWRGLFVPIRAILGKSEDDLRRPPTVIYRLLLSSRDYRRVVRTVRWLQTYEHRWHAIFFNCNDFAIVVASAIGLRRPPSLLPPQMWVETLRLLNTH